MAFNKATTVLRYGYATRYGGTVRVRYGYGSTGTVVRYGTGVFRPRTSVPTYLLRTNAPHSYESAFYPSKHDGSRSR